MKILKVCTCLDIDIDIGIGILQTTTYYILLVVVWFNEYILTTSVHPTSYYVLATSLWALGINQKSSKNLPTRF